MACYQLPWRRDRLHMSSGPQWVYEEPRTSPQNSIYDLPSSLSPSLLHLPLLFTTPSLWTSLYTLITTHPHLRLISQARSPDIQLHFWKTRISLCCLRFPLPFSLSLCACTFISYPFACSTHPSDACYTILSTVYKTSLLQRQKHYSKFELWRIASDVLANYCHSPTVTSTNRILASSYFLHCLWQVYWWTTCFY
jgi:hypothetical protein